MRIVQQLDEGLWRKFVDDHPQGQIFHTPEMFQVFARTKGYKPCLWAAVDDYDHPLALFLPVQISLMGGLLRRLTTRAVDYAGVLCVPGSEGQTSLKELLSAYKRAVGKSLLFTELRNLSDMDDLQPVLDESGFAFKEHLNFLIDLTRSQDEIWSSIRSNARRNIRKARKMNVVVEMISDPGRIPAVYDLLQKVYQRIQVPLADESFFRASFDILHPEGMMEILVARAEGVDIGALMLFSHRGTVCYWYTGTLREYTRYRAGDFLVWHALEWGRQNGFRVLDFGGAGKPDEAYGVRDFKAKFGGKLVSFGRNICVHAPLTLKISEFMYQGMRKLLYGRRD